MEFQLHATALTYFRAPFQVKYRRQNGHGFASVGGWQTLVRSTKLARETSLLSPSQNP
jgi:hypothetical protein